MYDGGISGLGWAWVLAVAILGVAIWSMARAAIRGPVPPSPPSGDSAEETLLDRYARGEIGRDEYRARMKALHRS